uniref:Uncharacterized protein n=1 Tax=Solanum tuberosum TaxID=4113 RepID=M1DP60_SOLTU
MLPLCQIYQREEVEDVKIVPAPKKDEMLVLRKHAKKPLVKVDSGRIFTSSDEPIGKDVTVAEDALIELENGGILSTSLEDLTLYWLIS